MNEVKIIAELIQKALDAGPTDGPWRGQELEARDGSFFPSFTALPSGRFHHDPQVDADYIAACNPANIRVLLAAIAAQPPQQDKQDAAGLLDDAVIDMVKAAGLDWHAGFNLDDENRYGTLARMAFNLGAAQNPLDSPRFHYLCQDMKNGPEKRERDRLLNRMCVMTYAAICAEIDAARAASVKGE